MSSTTVNILLPSKYYDKVSGRIVYNFAPNVRFTDQEIAVTDASFYNSFPNVTAAMQNNVIPYTIPIFTGPNAVTFVNDSVTLADGFYSETDLNFALQQDFLAKKYYLLDPANKPIFFAAIVPNLITYSTDLKMFYLPTQADIAALGWTIPVGSPFTGVGLNSGNQHYTTSLTITFNPGFTPSGSQLISMATLLGFPSTTVTPIQGPSVAPFTQTPFVVSSTVAPEINPVTSVIIQCNMINVAIANPVNMLKLIPVTAAFGSINHFEANFPLFSNVVDNNYHFLQLSFLDQNLNPIKFFDPAVNFTVQIRKRGSQ